jgi:uncharacterized protein YjbI with pentapeptide repeats
MQKLPSQAEQQRRIGLHHFVFSQMLIGHHHRPILRAVLTIMAYSTFVILPVLVQLLAQIMFLPYHSVTTTWWHRILIVINISLLWLLWIPVVNNHNRVALRLRVYSPRRWRRLSSRWRQFYHHLGEPLNWLAWSAIRVLNLFNRVRQRLFGNTKYDWRLLPLQKFSMAAFSVVALTVAFVIATIPGEFLARPLDARIGPAASVPLVSRNLVVQEANLVNAWPTRPQIDEFGADRAWQNFGKSISLRGRDLRYGDFLKSNFTRADLRGANLVGASLVEATLHNTQFCEGQRQNRRCAEIKDANLAGTELRGVDLITPYANLMRVNLAGTDLEEADLLNANLSGAVLTGTNLKGANLLQANLQAARLNYANLQGANLQAARLEAAVLVGADLRGAHAIFARFTGAVLGQPNEDGANLAGANLGGADLRATDLVRVEFRGADLRNVKLWAALIDRDVERPRWFWYLADLRGINMEPIEDTNNYIRSHIRNKDEIVHSAIVKHLKRRLQWGTEMPPIIPPPPLLLPVIFDSGGSIFWGKPPTEQGYDEKLAPFLNDLGCIGDATPWIAKGLARRALEDQNRMFAKELAARLTGGTCVPAAGLPEDMRNRLEQLAGGFGPAIPQGAMVPQAQGGE